MLSIPPNVGHASSFREGGVSETRVSFSPRGVAGGADGTRPTKSSEVRSPDLENSARNVILTTAGIPTILHTAHVYRHSKTRSTWGI